MAAGKNVPKFLRDKGYDNPRDRPPKDYVWQVYNDAFQRLSMSGGAYQACDMQRPIPFTEMAAYHEKFNVPYSLSVFVDAMKIMEIEELNDRSKQ